MNLNVEFPVIEIIEGKTRLIVPDFKFYIREDGVYEPAWAPVFYNPKMEFNRDIAVVALTFYSKVRGCNLVVADPLAGVGVRGIRFAVEVDGVDKVYINDINPEAIKLAELNAKINNVHENVVLECFEANFMLNMRRMLKERLDYIDIDPFGSPVEFIDSSILAAKIGGLIGVTATDTATLCGLYPETCLRKYWAICRKVPFEKEMGLRILMGNIALRAAATDRFVEFKLAYYADHYFRVYFTVGKSAKKATRCLENLKYLMVEEREGIRIVGLEDLSREFNFVGPLWSGNLGDKDFIEGMLKVVKELDFLKSRVRIETLLNTIMGELNMPPYHYRLDKICKSLHLSMPSISKVLECLETKGYKAVRTHFDYRGFKTSAPYSTVIECLKLLK